MDLTGFRQKVSQQAYPREAYTVTDGITYMDIIIGAEQAYLNDVQVWSYLYKQDTAGDISYANPVAISEMSHLIYAIEILADS